MRCPAISRVSSSRIPPSDPNGVAILYPARSFFALLSEGLLWKRRGREALTLTQHHGEDGNPCLTAAMLHSHGPDPACDLVRHSDRCEKLGKIKQFPSVAVTSAESGLEESVDHAFDCVAFFSSLPRIFSPRILHITHKAQEPGGEPHATF